MRTINFENIGYLKSGNQKQRQVFDTLTNHRVMEKLSAFDPLLTGTVPIAVDTEESDLDIICCWTNKKLFVDSLTKSFSGAKEFNLTEKTINDNITILAAFVLDSFRVEIFGQNRPTREQEAYRHMLVEFDILNERGEEFRLEVIKQKRKGLKTEHAFGNLLGIKGDPYVELLRY